MLMLQQADATGSMVMVTASHRECGMRRSLAATNAAHTPTSKLPAAAQLKLDSLSPAKQVPAVLLTQVLGNYPTASRQLRVASRQ